VANYQLPEELLQQLKEKFPALEITGEQTVLAPAEELLALMKELKENPVYQFDYLTNVTAVDYADRFEVVYNLISLAYGYLLTVKVKLPDKDNPAVPSLCPLWGGADWQEKEVYDLMGINFTGYPGHPVRILLDDGFQGHPLRKDFQWEGGREP